MDNLMGEEPRQAMEVSIDMEGQRGDKENHVPAVAVAGGTEMGLGARRAGHVAEVDHVRSHPEAKGHILVEAEPTLDVRVSLEKRLQDQ